MDYPLREEELMLALKSLGNESPEAVLESGAVDPVLPESGLARMREALRGITFKDEMMAYALDLVRETRTMDSIQVGAGPRATQALLLSSRALAAIEGRDFVTPDDVRSMVYPVLAHRIVLRPEYEIEGVTVREAIQKLLERVAVPR
jgi:MoxR-like ATPase